MNSNVLYSGVSTGIYSLSHEERFNFISEKKTEGTIQPMSCLGAALGLLRFHREQRIFFPIRRGGADALQLPGLPHSLF